MQHSYMSRCLFGTLLAIIAIVTLSIVSTTNAQKFSVITYTVTKLEDTNDGSCDVDCSLREAIEEANAVSVSYPVAVRIEFAVDGVFELTHTDTNGALGSTLLINRAVLISGNGPDKTILDGAGQDEVLFIASSQPSRTTIRSLTIQNGYSEGTAGAGISAYAPLSLVDVVVQDNEAGAAGGGIFVLTSQFEMTQSIVQNNRAQNAAGGIWLVGGNALIGQSTISGNVVSGEPETSNFPERSASGLQISSGAEVEIVNSTLSGNMVALGGGAAISINNSFEDSVVSLTGVTIFENDSAEGASGIHLDTENLDTGASLADVFQIEGSIVANNVGADCNVPLPVPANAVNLDSDGTCGPYMNADNWLTADPQLGALQLNNGGTTPTHLPVENSIVINAAGSCKETTVDQNGQFRNINGPEDCDLGAAEFPRIIYYETSLTATLDALPKSGGYINYTFTLTPTQPFHDGTTDYQVVGFPLAGNIYPECTWQLPITVTVGEPWVCSFALLAPGYKSTTHLGIDSYVYPALHAIVPSTDGDRLLRTELAVDYEDANGIGPVSYWADNLTAAQALSRPIDTNRDGSPDGMGVYIGDYDRNGTCDIYEVWWSQKCIFVDEATMATLLQTTNPTDMRLVIARELLTTWINIEAGNDYRCAGIEPPINLAIDWLLNNSPQGLPTNGGHPLSSSNQEWYDSQWLYWWLEWYNQSAGNGCGVDVDEVSQGALRITVANVTNSTLANTMPSELDSDVSTLLAEDLSLNSELYALLTEVEILVAQDGVVSAEFVDSITEAYEAATANASPELQSWLESTWQKIDARQYIGRSAAPSWKQIQRELLPNSIFLPIFTQ